ncbi:cytochrome P450 family protein [Ceratobasidium sp. AG-Ba]|nr:cytochrome P450 family protein [Ceratobasidium sp. AG-Ba]
MDPSTVWVVGGLVVFSIYKLARIGRRERTLPNGPPTVPLLGNLNIFPNSRLYVKFTEWARIYGGIYSLKIGHQTAIVLTDMDVIKELMEKRSQSTAGRPPFYVGHLVTDGMNIGLSGYTESWRMQRRLAHEILSPSSCAKHVPIQQAESKQLIRDIMTNPKDFFNHTNRYSFSVILSVLFGKRAPRHDAQDVTSFHTMERLWHGILSPGATPPIDLLPILKYVPRIFAPWKIQCDKIRDIQQRFYFGLQHEAQTRLAQGNENGSFMEQVLGLQKKVGLNDRQVGYLGGSMIEGGAGTTSAWIKVLVMALAAYPDAQKKAHDELDRVVGSGRMPTLEDLPHLPYVQAIIKEVHRWRPITPLAVPHATIEEIRFKDYCIPSGTTIFMNTWGISHDPERYERPEDFWPDRWMLHEYGTRSGAHYFEANPTWFGSGRRACPGIHLANHSLAINTMNLLWAFGFSLAIDEHTKEPVPIDVNDFDEGFEMSPNPFKCSVTLRSKALADTVENEFAAAREDSEYQ